MKVLLILLGLILMSYMFVFHAGPTNGAFKSYKTQWNKKYDNADIENFRMTIFFENIAKIEAHNATPGITYWEGIN